MGAIGVDHASTSIWRRLPWSGSYVAPRRARPSSRSKETGLHQKTIKCLRGDWLALPDAIELSFEAYWSVFAEASKSRILLKSSLCWKVLKEKGGFFRIETRFFDSAWFESKPTASYLLSRLPLTSLALNERRFFGSLVCSRLFGKFSLRGW